MLGSTRSVPIVAKTPESTPIKRIRVASRVVEANLIHDVSPQYPPEAGRARIEGTVVLLAVIGADGSVKDLRLESGLPILAQAAIDAVKQWRYKPYLLNGAPVEVETQITVNFTLGGTANGSDSRPCVSADRRSAGSRAIVTVATRPSIAIRR